MTYQILRAAISNPAEFDNTVKKFVDDWNGWEIHEAKRLIEPDKYQAFPRGIAPAIISNAIREFVGNDGIKQYEADYVLLDELPVLDGDIPRLEEKKAQLRNELNRLEIKTRDTVMKPGRLMVMQIQNDMDAPRAAELRTKDFVAKENEKKDHVADHLTDDEESELAGYDERAKSYQALQRRFQEVRLYYAEQHAEVDDLDFSNINTWKPTPMVLEAPKK